MHLQQPTIRDAEVFSHPLVMQPPWPNDAAMLDRLAVWAPDPAVWRRILVDNPTRLYWAA